MKPTLSTRNNLSSLNWFEDRRFRCIDNMLSDNGPSSIASKLTMGMKYWWTPCAIFMIKPCFTAGIRIENESEIIRYWINGRKT